MSVQEIKRQLEQLTAEEQQQVESFLKARRIAESAEYRQRVAAAHERMDRGEGVSSAELRAILARQQSAAS